MITDHKRVIIIRIAGHGRVLIVGIEIFSIQLIVLFRRIYVVIHKVILLEGVCEIDLSIRDTETPVAEVILLAPYEN
jgi:hypothetical protein